MATEHTNGIVFRPQAFDAVAAHMRASDLSCDLEVLDYGEWDALLLLDGASTSRQLGR